MNTEIYFLTAGLALLTAAIACIIAWVAILKIESIKKQADDLERQINNAWEVIPAHRKTLDNLIAVAASQDRGIVLFAQKIYAQEEALKNFKQDLVTQRQVAAIVHDALTKEAN